MRFAKSNCVFTYEGNYCTIEGNCIISGEKVKVIVKNSDISKYDEGALIQDAFPYIDEDEREFLLSGIYNGWDDLFDEEFDDEFDADFDEELEGDDCLEDEFDRLFNDNGKLDRFNDS